MSPEHKPQQTPQQKAARTARWAVTMTKVRIRRVLSRTRWQFVTFCGKSGAESTGIIDLVALRKDHGEPPSGMKRGDELQIVVIQVKGGSAAKPTAEDERRLHVVAKRLRARHVLLATWQKGRAAQFFKLQPGKTAPFQKWTKITDLDAIFR